MRSFVNQYRRSVSPKSQVCDVFVLLCFMNCACITIYGFLVDGALDAFNSFLASIFVNVGLAVFAIAMRGVEFGQERMHSTYVLCATVLMAIGVHYME